MADGFKRPPLNSIKPLTEYKPADIQAAAEAAAAQHGLPKDLVLKVVKQESGFKPNAISSKGAIGPMQLMPETAKDLGVDPHNIDQNIEGGTRYLAQLHKRYGGDTNKALAAYNAGMGRVESGQPLPAETRNYVAQIGGGGRGGISPPPQIATGSGFKRPPLSSLKPLKPETPQKPLQSVGRTIGETARDVLSGMGGSALRSLKGLAVLAERGSSPFGLPGVFERGLESEKLKPYFESRPGAAEQVGSFGGEMIQAAIPGPAEAKLAAKINEVLPWGLRLAARVGLSGATTGALATIQSGGDPQAGLQGGKVAAGTTLFLGMLAAPLQKWGRKIQLSNIKPRAVDVKDGFKYETLDKIGLKGNLEQSFNQVENKLNQLRTARNNLIKPGTANVDLGKAFDETLKEVEQKAKQLHFGPDEKTAVDEIERIRNGVSETLYEPPIKPSGLVTPNKQPILPPKPSLNAVDIAKAENLKEFMGMAGSWAYGRGDRDANVKELVANTLYSKLRAEIERALGSQGVQVKALNKEMQDLIPVKHAMMARIPVEQRNQVFSLTDITALIPAVVTGDIRMLALEGLARAQKNIRYGNLARRAFPQGVGRYVGQTSPWIVPPVP